MKIPSLNHNKSDPSSAFPNGKVTFAESGENRSIGDDVGPKSIQAELREGWAEAECLASIVQTKQAASQASLNDQQSKIVISLDKGVIKDNMELYRRIFNNAVLRNKISGHMKEVAEEAEAAANECRKGVGGILKKYQNIRWENLRDKDALKLELKNFLLGAHPKIDRKYIDITGCGLRWENAYHSMLVDVLSEIPTDKIQSIRLPKFNFSSFEIYIDQNGVGRQAPCCVRETVDKFFASDFSRLIENLDVFMEEGDFYRALPAINNMTKLKSLSLCVLYSRELGYLGVGKDFGIKNDFLKNLSIEGAGFEDLGQIKSLPRVTNFTYGCDNIYSFFEGQDWQSELLRFGVLVKAKIEKIEILKIPVFESKFFSMLGLNWGALEEFSEHFLKERGFKLAFLKK
ncbi:hypothetical protein QS306_10495 [Paraburkholderia bonniea]|uniref:hypothetical protein n=1 Tax=Paraburkholderia bonniea TaxID=2152891 RepID=UPI001290D174|nr:hypothetical protein [Paraburkholderia bonniea]WJF89539.1 hypothetical protein QS306_10495 [Paraburkholderia bonniea]WJF92853.1 hypothetical protein QS308_10505 [Paraburkholderia bonniea]